MSSSDDITGDVPRTTLRPRTNARQGGGGGLCTVSEMYLAGYWFAPSTAAVLAVTTVAASSTTVPGVTWAPPVVCVRCRTTRLLAHRTAARRRRRSEDGRMCDVSGFARLRNGVRTEQRSVQSHRPASSGAGERDDDASPDSGGRAENCPYYYAFYSFSCTLSAPGPNKLLLLLSSPTAAAASSSRRRRSRVLPLRRCSTLSPP